MQSVNWFSVEWGPLPKDKIHGILKGYRLIYYMSYRSDVPIGGEVEPIVHDFDKFTYYYKVTGLKNYATHNVTVTGYTNAGNGPTPEYYASEDSFLFLFYTLPVILHLTRSFTQHSVFYTLLSLWPIL